MHCYSCLYLQSHTSHSAFNNEKEKEEELVLLLISGYISIPLAEYILQVRHYPQHQRGMIILLILSELLIKRAEQTCNMMGFKSKISKKRRKETQLSQKDEGTHAGFSGNWCLGVA